MKQTFITSETNTDLVDYAASVLGNAKERAGFAPYTVNIDGESIPLRSRTALERLLSTVRKGEKCRVFRNAAKGATVSFE